MTDSFVEAILQNTDGILKLATPPAPDEKYIRSSLLPNICKAVVKNERFYNEFAIFEEAQIFKDENYVSKYDEKELLPSQRRNIAGAFAAPADTVPALFRRAKGVVENMCRFTHMEAFDFVRETKPVWADEVVWLNIKLHDSIIGNVALLNKKASLACGIKNLGVILFEIDTDALKPFTSRTNTFAHIAEYPTIEYDLSMLFDAETKWSDIRDTVLKKKNSDSFLKDVHFIDEYKGAQVPEGKKSVTIRLVLGSSEKTLTSNEIEATANTIIKFLTKNIGAEMRK